MPGDARNGGRCLRDSQARSILFPPEIRMYGWGDAQPGWKNRAQFFSASAEAMRRILVERARSRAALKRGGQAVSVSAEEIEIPVAVAPDEELLAVDEALQKLARVDPRKAELVKLRYFTGLTFEEAAEVLDIAVPTAKEWWAYARAWLSIEIRR